MIFTKDEATKSYFATVDGETIVEVGDKSDPTKLRPALKLSKWSDKSSFELSYKSTNGSDDTTTNDKVKWREGAVRAEFYGIDPDQDHPGGALEFSMIFDAAPASNTIEFDYKAKKAFLHYQGPLTDLIGQDGVVTATATEGKDAAQEIIMRRPENVVGSFAVYADEKDNQYKAGKIGHIYRPKITDANSVSAWCELVLDEQKKTLSVIIPQSFLDAAVFPIVLDPAFGYTTIGGTEVFFNAPGSLGHVGSGLIYTPSAGHNRVTKFSIYGRGTSYDAAVYNISGGLPVNRVAAAVTVPLAGSNQWNDSAAVSQLLINGTTYGMAVGNAQAVYTYFDTGSGNQRSQCATNLPATWSSTGVTSAMYSWYATAESIDMLL